MSSPRSPSGLAASVSAIASASAHMPSSRISSRHTASPSRRIAGDIQALLQSEGGRAVLDSRNPLRLLRLIRVRGRASADQTWDDILAACAGADVLVSLGMFYYTPALV